MKLNEVLKEQEIPTVTIKNTVDYDAAIEKYEGQTVNANEVILRNIGGLKELDFKFNEIFGDFNVSQSGLTSLKNLPVECYGLNISSNRIGSLKDLPTKIVKGPFNCAGMNLTSLEGSPEKILGAFNCIVNKLENLKGGPKVGVVDYFCKENQLTSLEGICENMFGLYCMHNKLTSLAGIHKLIKSVVHIDISSNIIVEGGIGLILIKNLESVETSMCGKRFKDAIKIISKYFNQGKVGLLACQEELEQAGLDEFAKL